MEQMPHHREGMQNELDKAYDEGHRDNKAIDEANMRAEGETHISDDVMQSQLSEKENAMVAGQEKEVSPELAEIIARLRERRYLDTSFEGKETHLLSMRPLSKEEALAEYRTSGGETLVNSKLERFMTYVVPREQNLEVVMMNFNRGIAPDSALKEMSKFGVRPLTYEELIQYGIAHPSHQEQKTLVGLGSLHFLLNGDVGAPILDVSGKVRYLNAGLVPDDWSGFSSCFPVVREEE